jgi:hypothetical protein
MIHQNLSDNWKKILEYNEKIIQKKISTQELAKVRIPLTPIRIRPDLLSYLFSVFYPHFINDQQNIADIIISETEEELVSIKLYKTPEPGVHTSFKEIDTDIIKLKKYPISERAEFFNELQTEIFDEYEIRVSHMRVVNKKALGILNNHLEDIEKVSFENSFTNLLDIVEELIRDELFFIFPKPNIMNFIEEILRVPDNLPFLSKFFSFIKNLFPKLNVGLVLKAPEQSFVVKLENMKEKPSENHLDIQILKLEEFDINPENMNNQEILESLYSQLDIDSIFLTQQKLLIKLLGNIFELQYPIDFGKLKLFMQKILFGFRSYERLWNQYPKSLSYNPLIRWFLEIFGILYHLKKLSHWEIPEFLFSSFNLNNGLKNRIIIIFTDLHNHSERSLKDIDNPIELGFTEAVLLESENRKLTNIISITEKVKEFSNLDLKRIRSKLMEQFGYTDLLISIDIHLLRKVIENYIIKFNSFNILSKIRTLGKFKKDYYFDVYPTKPEIKYIKNTGTFSLAKRFLSIFIDRHLF